MEHIKNNVYMVRAIVIMYIRTRLGNNAHNKVPAVKAVRTYPSTPILSKIELLPNIRWLTSHWKKVEATSNKQPVISNQLNVLSVF
jgi:hypothetical protein